MKGFTMFTTLVDLFDSFVQAIGGDQGLIASLSGAII